MPQRSILDELIRKRIIAVLVLSDPETASDVAAALMDGGIDAIELTLRTPAALECLGRIRAAHPEMLVGAGTVLTAAQVAEVAAAEADFAVSPGLNRRVVAAAEKVGLPFAPGVATPSDVETAWECGCRLLKFFPAGPLGGLTYLRSMAAPYQHLGVQFIPLGGVGPKNLVEYLSEPLVGAVGGSWLAPADAIARRDWETIRDLAAAARQVVDQLDRDA
jgi:2-dehydro-3-deoxyphosphogluconate aldolase/(4S)-4-hydroxy-2-oxoglutarate aldolase